MALENFERMLQNRLAMAQAQRQVDQEAFEMQKYNDLIARQAEKDAISQAERDRQFAAGGAAVEALQFASPQGSPLEAVALGMEGIDVTPTEIYNVSNLIKNAMPQQAAMDMGDRYVQDMVDVYLAENPNASDVDIARVRSQAARGWKRSTVSEEGEKSKAKKLGGVDVEVNKASYDAAKNSKNIISKLNKTEDILKKGNAITGWGSEFLTGMERIRSKILGDEKAGVNVRDSQYLDALLGSDVFPLIKQLGIGARGLDTPAEREFLLQVMTGSRSLDRSTLMEMVQLRKEAALRDIEEYKYRTERGFMDDIHRSSPLLRFDDMEQPKPQETGGWSIKRK